MAFYKTIDADPAILGPGAIFELKELLKTAGWTVEQSSDAVTYNSTGDEITDGSAGASTPVAGGFNNASAWFVITDPDGVKSLCFQRSNVFSGQGRNFRIKYSPSAGFTGGSPGITQTPSATDEHIVRGGGTDASPSFGQIFAGTNTNDYVNVIAEDANGYGFLLHTRAKSGNTGNGGFLFDPIIGVDGEDDVVLYCPVSTTAGQFFYDTGQDGYTGINVSYGPQYVFDAAGTPTMRTAAACMYGQANSAGSFFALTVLNTDESPGSPANHIDLLPIFYCRPAGEADPDGFVGRSTFVRAMPDSEFYGYTISASGTRDFVMFSQQFATKWDGSVYNTERTGTDWGLGGGGAAVAPNITNFSPAVGSAITPDTVIGFDITDDSGVASAVVFVTYADGIPQIIHDGDSFRGNFQGTENTRVAIAGGYRYTVRPDKGWPSSPTIEYVVVDDEATIGVIA